MKKLILSFAFAGAIMVASTACNSTKNASQTTDSVGADTTMMPVDTAVADTSMMPVDTTTLPPDTIQ